LTETDFAQIKAVARNINAFKYVETSALTGFHVQTLFDDSADDLRGVDGAALGDDPLGYLFGMSRIAAEDDDDHSSRRRGSVSSGKPSTRNRADSLHSSVDLQHSAAVASDASLTNGARRGSRLAASSSPVTIGAQAPSALPPDGLLLSPTKRSSALNPLAAAAATASAASATTAASPTPVKRSSVLITQLGAAAEKRPSPLSGRTDPRPSAVRASPDSAAHAAHVAVLRGSLPRPQTQATVLLPSSRGPGGAAGAAAAARRRRHRASAASSLSSLSTTSSTSSSAMSPAAVASAAVDDDYDDGTDGDVGDADVGGGGLADPDDVAVGASGAAPIPEEDEDDVDGDAAADDDYVNGAVAEADDGEGLAESLSHDADAAVIPLPPALPVPAPAPAPSAQPAPPPSLPDVGNKKGAQAGLDVPARPPPAQPAATAEKQTRGCQCSIL
ncbi:hypothetical protein HK405_015291, partial [Cladochytrium tenue]